MLKKLKSLAQLKKIIKKLKARKKKIVFTNGCFDLLHYGHVKYLEEAKAKGDYLVVAVNSDASVRKIKGKKRPLVAAGDRMRLIACLESVDYVVPFGDLTPLRVIRQLRPDILIKGADWPKGAIIGADFVQSYGGGVLTLKLAEGRSTTKLIKKIVQTYSR